MKKIFWVICFSISILLLKINVILAFDGFYTLGDQNIEFRLAKKIDDFSSHRDWPVKKDIKGNKFFVSDEVCVNKADVEGILVEKLTEEKSANFILNGKAEQTMNYCEDNPYRVSIYFKKDSWKKIRELAERGMFYNLAMVKEGKILWCAAVMGRFDKEAYLSMMDKKTMNLLLEGLKIDKEPSLEQRELDYENWLIDNIKCDISYARDLSSIATKHSKAKNYQEAIKILKLILSYYPTLIEDCFQLGDCYFRQKDYDNAINVFEKGISQKPDLQYEVILQMYIGDCYSNKEQYSQALEKYKLCFEKVKTSEEFPDKDGLIIILKKRIKSIEKEVKPLTTSIQLNRSVTMAIKMANIL
jgi:tetratricopeptide (TPR) repeat protein